VNQAHGGTPDLTTAHRQSLWAVAFLALRTLRQVGIVQVLIGVGFVVSRSPSILVLLALVAIIGAVLFLVATLQWWRYTFRIEGTDLLVRRGVLSQQTLTIPLERVQSISLEQKLLHRVVGLEQITLETAGEQGAEFTIDAIEEPVALELQRVTADHRITTAASTGVELRVEQPRGPEQQILRHTPNRIIKTALTQMPFAGLVLLAPLFAIGDELAEYIPFDLPTVDGPRAGWWLAWAIPLVLLVGLVLSVMLNVIRVVLLEWDLTVTSTPTGLRRRSGLLSKTNVATSIPRVQRITTEQRVLERLTSLYTVDLKTIGDVRLAVPGCNALEAGAVRSLAFGSPEGFETLDRKVSPEVIFQQTRNWGVISAILAAGLYWSMGAWSLLFLLLTPWFWFETRRRTLHRRWDVSREAIADHHEFLGWRRFELLLRKVNGVSLRQGLFERKRDLATVTLATAAGNISIGMIPLTEARALRDLVLSVVETDHRAWM